DIIWTVELANKKGAFFRFSGNAMDNQIWNDKAKKWEDKGNRKAPVMTPGKQSITVKKDFDPKKDSMSRAEMKASTGRFDDLGEEIGYLGEILHDEQGRLIVL